MKLIEELAARRRFGMKPGLEAIRAVCSALGNPESSIRAIHVAGTNGKGAVAAILDAAIRAAGFSVGRYTSPHLVKLNERFFLNGVPIGDAELENAADELGRIDLPGDFTFFEALTAVAFRIYAGAKCDYTVLETGLGGRLDATNVCHPVVSVITKVGLDHCDWLGDTVGKIAAEKAGIIKPGIPVVLGRNCVEVREVVEARARQVGAPFFYAPEIAAEDEIPVGFSLPGAFNRENAVTALAVLKTLGISGFEAGFGSVIWPGRYQRVGSFIIDGAHNPPAAEALALALKADGAANLNLIAGFCADKDVGHVMSALSPLVKRAFAVKTVNPRSLSAEDAAELMRGYVAGVEACGSLDAAIGKCANEPTLVCGSLFLAGEALVKLGAYPWNGLLSRGGFDPAEKLKG